MTRRVLTLAALLFVPAACGSDTPEPDTTETQAMAASEPVAGPAILALHLYNPASDEAHQRFLSGFTTLNQAIRDAGQPQTGYQAWKVTGEQSGEYGYLFGSIWTDQATYDAVHAHQAYTTATAALDDGTEPLAEQVYNRYAELNPAVGEPVPVPDGGPPLLALHLFNLPTPDSEAEFISLLDDLNAAIVTAGHPETRYTFWKVTGEQAGTRAYLFGSFWTDRATYDAVHAHPDYEISIETHRAAFERLVLDDVYNQYEMIESN